MVRQKARGCQVGFLCVVRTCDTANVVFVTTLTTMLKAGVVQLLVCRYPRHHCIQNPLAGAEGEDGGDEPSGPGQKDKTIGQDRGNPDPHARWALKKGAEGLANALRFGNLLFVVAPFVFDVDKGRADDFGYLFVGDDVGDPVGGEAEQDELIGRQVIHHLPKLFSEPGDEEEVGDEEDGERQKVPKGDMTARLRLVGICSPAGRSLALSLLIAHKASYV